MRIDKYIKLTRIIKRRTVAKVLIDEGKILINGKIAKPSSNVVVGDIVSLKLGSRNIKIEVINCQENVNKKDSKALYKLIADNITTTEVIS